MIALLQRSLLIGTLAIAGCKAQEALPIVPPPSVAAAPPQALPDVAVVEVNSASNSIDVLDNDIDPVGEGLTVTTVTVDQAIPPLGGSVAGTDGSAVSFTPAANYVGVVLLGYTVVDARGAMSSSVIAVSVLPLVPPPVALPDVATVLQNSASNDIDVLANDIDLAGGGLQLAAGSVTQSLPAGAHTVSMASNKLRFTPAAGFIGAVVVGYTVTDSNGASADGVLTVVVSPVAVPLGPVTVPDAAIVSQDAGATDVDVLANDVDPAGGGLVLGGLSVTASLPTATHGLTVVANRVRFTPAAGFIGSVVVGYTATDVNGNAAAGVLAIVVSPIPLLQGPVAVPDAAVVTQNSGATDIDVLANDVDVAGGGLTLGGISVSTSIPGATHTLAVVGNKLQFTPAAGFAGAVVIAYDATDINNNSASGILTVVVSPIALTLGPVPLPDAAAIMQDSGPTDINVLANDIDLAGQGLTVGSPAVTSSLPAATHTLAVAGNRVRFTPAAGFAGAVVVSYTATDGNGRSAPGVLTVVVSPVDLPVGLVAIPDTAVVAQNSGGTSIDVLANDVDFAGGGLTLTMVSVFSSLPSATHAVAIVGNQVRFTPAAGFAGVVVVSYTAIDANGLTGNGLLDITVTPSALTLGPVAVPDVATRSSTAGATSIDVLANDVDPAGGGLTLTQVSITLDVPGGSGSVSIVGNQVRYTPTVLYIGAVLIGYTATDSNGRTTLGQLALTVTL